MNQVAQEGNLPYYIWRLADTLHHWHIPLLPFLLQQILRLFFCCFIPYYTNLGRHIHLAHLGMGIVIHKEAIIGNNVLIDQHVTIGGRVGSGLPTIGNNVRIGANAVVLQNVPDNATAVGVPARIILKS